MVRARSLAVGVLLVASIVPLALPIEGSAVPPEWEFALALAESQALADPLIHLAALEGLILPQVSLATKTDLNAVIDEALELRGAELSRAMKAEVRAQVQSLAPALKVRVAVLLSAASSLELHLDKAWERVTPDEVAYLLSLPADSDDSRKMEILDEVDRALTLAATIQFLNILDAQSQEIRAQRSLFRSSDEITLMSHGCTAPEFVIPPEPINGMHVLQVGLEGPNCYNSPPTVVSIDLGGDDEYGNNPGTAVGLGGGVPVSVAVDAGGNDNYGNSQSGGNWKGVGIVLDFSGDDNYLSADKQATGWNGGIGFQRDMSGVDHYTCFTSCQGTGTSKGVGILWDDAGDDTYTQGDAAGQGYGAAMGTGILLDQDGADRYLSTVGAQGFSDGEGTGVLVDRAGADTYNVSHSNFGRATHNPNNPANWGNMIFLDMDGDDIYEPRADGLTPPDSRDATNGKFEWGPGQTGTFYIKGIDCEGGAANCVPATGIAPVDDLNDDLGTVECIATSLPNEAACPVK